MAEGLAIISLILTVASFVFSIVASEQAKNAIVDVDDMATLGDVNHTQQSEGLPIPIIFGDVYICGNIVWWDAVMHENEFNRINVHQILCENETDHWLTQAFKNGKQYGTGGFQDATKVRTLWEKHWAESGDTVYIIHTNISPVITVWDELRMNEYTNITDYTIAPYGIGYSVYIVPTGSIDQENIQIRIRTTFFGLLCSGEATTNKIPDGNYLSLYPDGGQYVRKLVMLTHVHWESFEMEPSETMIPTLKFYLRSIMRYSNDYIALNNAIIVDGNGVHFGNNPSAVIYEMLMRIGVPYSEVNYQSFQDACDYYYTKNWGLNFILPSVNKVSEYIKKIQSWVECFLVKDEDNKYAIKYFLDTDADSPEATIVDQDVIEFELRRKAWEDTFNKFVVNYSEIFTNEYGNDIPSGEKNTKTLTLKNEANISLTGNEREKIVDLTAFKRPAGPLGGTAHISDRASQILQKESYPFATGIIVTNLKFSYLKEGDVFQFVSTKYNISTPFRIMSININELDNNRITFGFVQMRENIASSYYEDAPVNESSRAKQAYLPSSWENITFEPFKAVSNVLGRTVYNDESTVVSWGADQGMYGVLEYDTDYTIDDHNKVHLDENLYSEIILGNSQGLLNVNIYESGDPTEES